MEHNWAHPHTGGTSFSDSADATPLRQMVRRVIAEQLAALPATPAGDGRSPDAAQIAGLAPVVRSLVTEAVRAGLVLRQQGASSAVQTPAPPPAEDPAQRAGRLMLRAGPFAAFIQVRRFLDDLARVPRVTGVRPQSFADGQLVVVLQSDYTDTQALIDRLATDLAPYRLVVRSIHPGSVELLVRRPAP